MLRSLPSPPNSKVAFVAGANGISGHALIEHLIRTPHQEWSQIIITSRKPPPNYWVDPRVRFIAIDFLEEPREDVLAKLRSVCKEVTHAFFTSYVHNGDSSKLAEKNCPLWYNFLDAVDKACPRLQRVNLQTGGKHYAIGLQRFSTPCYEDTPRYKGKGQETIFYYKQEDDLFAIQKRRKTNPWHYSIIRPFGIIGFTPQFSGINSALCLAQYFLISRELRVCPRWPGNYNGWHQVEGESYAPSVADMHVWAATTESAKDQAFNHGNGDTVAWRFLWTLFAEYFGVSIAGAEPDAPGSSGKQQPQVTLAEWAKDKQAVWERLTDKYGGRAEAYQGGGFELLDWEFSPDEPGLVFATAVQKARALGWSRMEDSYRAWTAAFRSYENAGVLPVRESYSGEK
ncbi:hypothetical protein BJY04DRAFT_214152 [Aspergillus karnatakaensis]|uniref:SDR family oxidoreductase n=1 Tax=Aspergillus karnatakaensis TaxID=1810916 RepID=UPI003CCDC145